MIKIKYTDESLQKSIGKLDQVIVLQDKIKINRLELRNQLLRMQRAIKPMFWLDSTTWRKMTFKERLKLMRETKGIQIPHSDSMFNTKEFYFYAKQQWKKDREQLILEGKIPL